MNKIDGRGITFDDVLLVPRKSNIESRFSKEIDTKTFLTSKINLNTPIISSPMNSVTDFEFANMMNYSVGGIGAIHRFQPPEKQLPYTNPDMALPIVRVCAIGLKDYERAKYLYEHGCRCFLIDVANGHTDMVCNEIRFYKNQLPDIEIIAGNIVTYDAAIDLIRAGADSLRVGIGGGSVCTTRVVTGCGIPNLTAIQNVRKAIDEYEKSKISLISDGGIRSSGDCVKCLAFGADVVMLGRMLAVFSKSGRIIKQGEEVYKVFEGQSSRKFQEEVRGEMRPGTAPEGVEIYLKMRYDMTLEQYIEEIMGGIRSAFTYLGCRTIKELRGCEYIEISEASKIESYPRLA